MSPAQELDRDGRRYTRRRFLRMTAGLAVSAFLPGCRRAAEQRTPAPIPKGWIATYRYKKEPPWRLGRSSRGDISSWMVMFSAHVEYGVREKYREYFRDDVSIAANWDPNKQIEDIRGLLAQDIDLLLIDPLDTTVVARGVAEAMEQGVPVILASSRVADAPYVSWVTTDAEERGAACALWMSQSVAAGRVAVLQSQFAAGDQQLWLQGARSQLDAHPALEPIVVRCPWSSAAAQQTVTSLLQQHTSIEGLIVHNGVLARGAVEAFVEQGREIPPIAGADDWNGWLRTARQYSVRFWALSGGANLGLYCIELATEVLSGHETPTYVPFPYQGFGEGDLDHYFRPDLSDHYWAVHDLPEAWIERMYRT